MYINDLPDGAFPRIGNYTDDATAYSSTHRSGMTAELEEYLRCIVEWGEMAGIIQYYQEQIAVF